jgi:hypothetical protein
MADCLPPRFHLLNTPMICASASTLSLISFALLSSDYQTGMRITAWRVKLELAAGSGEVFERLFSVTIGPNDRLRNGSEARLGQPDQTLRLLRE